MLKLKIHQKPTTVNPEKIEPVSFPQKHPKAYTYKSGLQTEFTMTKRLLELEDNNGRPLHMQTKFILGCLMTSAVKINKHITVLTSVRRLIEHFGISERQIQYTLHKLQETQVQGVNLIDYRNYNEGEAIQCLYNTAKEENLYSNKAINKKQEYASYNNLRSLLSSRQRERFIEIQISAYNFIKYDAKQKKDFFFDVHVNMYKESLDITQRVLLFLLQNRIQQNKHKGMQEKTIIKTSTLADYFNFYPFYMQKILKSLHDKKYIVCTQNGDKTTIVLTEKGSRKIRRFEDGSVEKYSRENRKKMEEEKAKAKATKKTTKLPKPQQDVLQEMKVTEGPSNTQRQQMQQPPQTQQEQKKEAPKREVPEGRPVWDDGSAEAGKRKLAQVRESQRKAKEEGQKDTWSEEMWAIANDNIPGSDKYEKIAEPNWNREEDFKNALKKHRQNKLLGRA